MSVGYIPVHDYSKDYFTMLITTGGTVTWRGTSSNALSYSTDDGTTWSTASKTITLPVNEGDKVLWKGTPYPYANSGIGKFGGDTNVRYSVEGNVMSLLFGDDFKGQTSLSGKNYALYGLFMNSNYGDDPNVISAENLSLPATTLAQYCYNTMFFNCTNLTTAPELPATTLENSCYYQMFMGCTNLTTAPELPATTLAQYCYNSMFNGCTNLTTAPSVLPATTLARSCYSFMFKNTSLTTAPELPATTLENSCYYQMFYSCTSLDSIKCLATDISATECTENWVNGVAASGTFTKDASMSSWTTGDRGIPSGWTVVDAA